MRDSANTVLAIATKGPVQRDGNGVPLLWQYFDRVLKQL